MGEWPDRLRSASSAWSTLSELWAAVAVGRCRPPAADEIEARVLFGTPLQDLSTDGSGVPIPYGGPSWSQRGCPPGFLVGSFSRRDPPGFPRIPASLFRVVDAVQLAGGRALVGEYADVVREVGGIPVSNSLDPVLWVHPLARNAPRSDERARLGVVPPPYAPTPSGTYACALAAIVAADLADVIDAYAADRPASEARPFRREATEIREFGDAVETYVDSTSASWLAKANAWISIESASAGRPKITPATLRDR